MALTHDEDHARDLVQETVAKTISATGVPRDRAALRVWMFRVLRNVFVDWRRRDRITIMDPADLVDRVGGDDWSEERQITNMAVRRAYLQLSDDHREVVYLVDVEGRAYAEVAEVTGVPKGTVMSRLARARDNMARALKEDGVEPMVGRVDRAK